MYSHFFVYIHQHLNLNYYSLMGFQLFHTIVENLYRYVIMLHYILHMLLQWFWKFQGDNLYNCIQFYKYNCHFYYFFLHLWILYYLFYFRRFLYWKWFVDYWYGYYVYFYQYGQSLYQGKIFLYHHRMLPKLRSGLFLLHLYLW